MEIKIIYCAVWNYEPHAVSLAEYLMKQLKQNISNLILIPSDGGKFEISKNGKLLFSKLQAGRFPENDEILKLVKSWFCVPASPKVSDRG